MEEQGLISSLSPPAIRLCPDTLPPPLRASFSPGSFSLRTEVAAASLFVSTAYTGLTDDHWQPEPEKDQDRPGQLPASSWFASGAFDLIGVVNSRSTEVIVFIPFKLFLFCFSVVY